MTILLIIKLDYLMPIHSNISVLEIQYQEIHRSIKDFLSFYHSLFLIV